MVKNTSRIDFINKAVSKDETKYVLQAPLIHEHGMVSTDGYRMHWVGELPESAVKTYLGRYPDVKTFVPKPDATPTAVFSIEIKDITEAFKNYKALAKANKNGNSIELSIEDNNLVGMLKDTKIIIGKTKTSILDDVLELSLNFQLLNEAVIGCGFNCTISYYGQYNPIMISHAYNALLMPIRSNK